MASNIDVDTVKKLLRITTTQYDDYLATVLPMAEDYVQQWCNNKFLDAETGEIVYPEGVKLAIAKICQYHMKDRTVQSETLARHSITYAAAQYPPEVYTILSAYRRPWFVPVRRTV